MNVLGFLFSYCIYLIANNLHGAEWEICYWQYSDVVFEIVTQYESVYLHVDTMNGLPVYIIGFINHRNGDGNVCSINAAEHWEILKVIDITNQS